MLNIRAVWNTQNNDEQEIPLPYIWESLFVTYIQNIWPSATKLAWRKVFLGICFQGSKGNWEMDLNSSMDPIFTNETAEHSYGLYFATKFSKSTLF